MNKDEIIPSGDPTLERRVGDDPPSEVVIEAVAEALGRDPLDLPPLYDAIDPDALDRLFADVADDSPGNDSCFTFEYCDCTVVLAAPGRVLVDAAD